jgi:lipopolysaccharide biosynthesis protein
MQSLGRRRIWPDVATAQGELANSGNWVHNSCEIQTFDWNEAEQSPTAPDFSIHIHAFYIDELEVDLLGYRAFKLAKQILVTTDTVGKSRQIVQIGERVGIPLTPVVVPNQGRDILPLMRLISDDIVEGEGEDLWCHVHMKKSVGVTDNADIWKKFLLTILLGDAERLSPALFAAAKPENGLVTAFDPHFLGWGGAGRQFGMIKEPLRGSLPKHPLVFPVGNMFWCKRSVVAEMTKIFGTNFPWPNEPLANDGTIFHLIERLWPTAAALAESKTVFFAKPDQQRL